VINSRDITERKMGRAGLPREGSVSLAADASMASSTSGIWRAASCIARRCVEVLGLEPEPRATISAWCERVHRSIRGGEKAVNLACSAAGMDHHLSIRDARGVPLHPERGLIQRNAR